MAEIFYIGNLPIKTNHPGDFYRHLEDIKIKIKSGFFCGEIQGYWWIVPLDYSSELPNH